MKLWILSAGRTFIFTTAQAALSYAKANCLETFHLQSVVSSKRKRFYTH